MPVKRCSMGHLCGYVLYDLVAVLHLNGWFTMMIDILLMCVLVILWDILDSDVSLHHLQYTECLVNVMKFMKLKWIIYENVKK